MVKKSAFLLFCKHLFSLSVDVCNAQSLIVSHILRNGQIENQKAKNSLTITIEFESMQKIKANVHSNDIWCEKKDTNIVNGAFSVKCFHILQTLAQLFSMLQMYIKLLLLGSCVYRWLPIFCCSFHFIVNNE